MTREETINLLKKHNFEIIPEYSNKDETENLLYKNKTFCNSKNSY